MKERKSLCSGLLALSLVCGLNLVCALPALGSSDSASASVSRGKELKILVVDLEEVINASKAGRSLRAQLEKRSGDIQKKASDQNAKINAEAKALDGKRSKMSDDEYNKSLEALTKKRDDGLKEVRSMSDELRGSLELAQGKIDRALKERIFPSILEREGGAIVLPKGYVVAVNSQSKFVANVTSQVVSALDGELPTIKLEAQPEPRRA